MKNKPLRHKKENTFKFVPFNERIASIKVDVFHNVKHKYEEEEDEVSFFQQTLDKWIYLNCTECFVQLRNDIGDNVQILAQILTQKDRLISVLEKHLELKNPLNLQPLLELIVALAKDIRMEFYPYFQKILNNLINLLSTKNTDVIEWTFQCLAHLYKLLWRYLVANITEVFDSLLPLLKPNKPIYVVNFAAQSFAFVARKLKDQEKLLKLLLRSLKNSPQSVEGCGRLAMEVMRGVPGQFHSCAESVFTTFLTALEDSSFPFKILSDFLKSTMAQILTAIQPNQLILIWNILQKKLLHFYNEWTIKEERNSENMLLTLDLLQMIIEHKKGACLTEPESLVSAYLNLLGPNQTNTLVTSKIANSLSSILLSSVKLTQEMSSKIIIQTMAYLDEDELINFITKIIPFPGFEGFVLTRLLDFCMKQNPMNALPLLTRLILSKKQLANDSQQLLSWSPYTLDFKNTKEGNINLYCKTYLDHLSKTEFSQLVKDLDTTASIIIVLPHILPIQKDEAVQILSNIINSAINHIDTDNQYLTLLSLCLECLIYLKPDKSISKLCSPTKIITALVKHSSNLLALRCLDFYITCDELNLIEPLVKTIQDAVAPNLLSPYHKFRELTTHIIYETEKSKSDANSETVLLFEECWNVEKIPASLSEYREKIKHMQKLAYKDTGESSKMFLKYLIGLLYINFKLMWEPVSKVILSYAENMKVNDFWIVFGRELENIAVTIRTEPEEPVILSPFNCESITEMFNTINVLGEKPDHIHHRILLWEILQNCLDICEKKNKDIATQFFIFLENEYFKRNADAAFTWDISKKVLDTPRDKVDDNENEDENLNESTIEDTKFRWVTKSLLAHMAVMSKMRSPKNVYRESDLAKIYYDFLSHKLPDVQKVALDCLMSYKHKYLTPYKDHLYGLIDEKTFKNEASLFRIDTQSEIVIAEHRPNLIPIVLRIVYSKMYSKTTSKGAKQARKGTVVRFLAGCSAEEINSFFTMAFSLVKDSIDSNPLNIIKIMDSVNLEKALPPKRLQSACHLMKILLVYCGGLLGNEQLSNLLKILLALSSNVAGVLKKRDKVQLGHVRLFRNIRNLCLDCLNKFFKSFESYPWTVDEIEAVFNVFIWPYLEKLPTEGIHSPTSLFKLFMTWSNYPKYYILLGKRNDELSPLKVIMKLWQNENTHASVSNAIMEIVENLLTLEMDSEDVLLQVKNHAELDIEKLKSIKRSLNYGSKLMLPYVPIILERLDKKLSNKQGLLKKDLEVMSRITEMVIEPEPSDKLLSLLLPNMIKKSGAGEGVVTPLLTTIYNLIKNVDKPGKYVRKLAPLFGGVTETAPRKMLFSIVINLSKQEGSESGLDDALLEDLNAWDAKWVDQPDFTRRLNAFKKLELMADEGSIPVHLGIIVIYTCFYFLKEEKDLALRDNAKFCLTKLCPILCNNANDTDKMFLYDTILSQIRSGLAEKQTEMTRNDSIGLLGHMARECDHPVLKDLSLLTNKMDLEVNFFENLQHLQLHRRVRALLKFSTVSESLEKTFMPRTITQFVIPIVSHYLVSEKYINKNTIVDSAIKAIGSACRQLPWHQYQSTLMYYMEKLQTCVEFQKQLIRIIVEILNAFHFDLSQGDEIETIDENGKIGDEIELQEEETEPPKEMKDILLSKSVANKVLKVITVTLLPRLNNVMAQRSSTDVQHKLNRKTTGPDRDEEDILRVPLAIAITKLLQKLPFKGILDRNLPGVLMKLCTFLKSRLESVRRVTRETLQTIMISLGPQYLGMLLNEMTSLLTRGFHVHVMTYSIHSVLVALKPHFKKGDIDKCAHSIINVCKMDLFGRSSEEKEVNQIVGKVLEARSNRSFDTFQILSKYVTESFLLDLVLPLKEELSRTLSHKYVSRVRECLQQITLGLTENEFLDPQSLLQFAYGTASEMIPALISDVVKPVNKSKTKTIQSDIYIIPQEPRRKKALETREAIKTNSHIIVEFGLRLFYFLLKREKLKDEHKPLIDPIVKLLMDCIKSQHVKISTLSIQCLSWILKMDLPSVDENIKEITTSLFSILHKFGAAGLSKGDNFDLVMASFKTVAVIVRNIKYKLDENQMRALILYCEQDINDHSRQATAFSLLKAITGKKIETPELKAVIKKVSTLSITAMLDSVRLQARQIVIHFLLDYNPGEDLEAIVGFYLSQLAYDHQPGRESALEMITSITKLFPLKLLQENCGIIFTHVSTRLTNDPIPECRKQAANIIITLLERLDNNSKDKLFDFTKLWMEDKNIAHKRLGVQLIGLFISVEKENFDKRLDVFLPSFTERFAQSFEENKPGRFVLIKNEQKQDSVTEEDRMKDHLLYQALQMMIKLCTMCPNVLKTEHASYLDTIAEHSVGLLGHAHEWVRHGAVQLIGLIASSNTPGDIAKIVNNKNLERNGFLLSDTSAKLKSLALDITSQLVPKENSNENFLMQCMKLLVLIAEIVKDIKSDEKTEISLPWLIRRVRKLINNEIVHFPSSTIVRTMSFNWMAALTLKLNKSEIQPIASHILGPLLRELNLENQDQTLLKVVKEAMGYLKKQLGPDDYNSLMAKLTTQLEVKKAERRKQRSSLMVTDPEKAAKRKINKQIKKKENKKRKVELMKKQRFKRKRKDVDLDY